MATSFADRIRKAAQEVKAGASAPAATPGIVRQAAVSTTGKAAGPGVGVGQTNIAENLAAAKAAAERATGAERVQDTAEEVAEAERGSEFKQQQFESEQRLKEHKAKSDYASGLKKAASKLKMATDRQTQDRETVELMAQLADKRMENKRYVSALQNAGRRERLDDKMSFRRAMKDNILVRGKQTAKEDDERRRLVQTWKAEDQITGSVEELEAALRKAEADAKAAKKAAVAGAVSGLAKAGIDYASGSLADEKVDPKSASEHKRDYFGTSSGPSNAPGQQSGTIGGPR